MKARCHTDVQIDRCTWASVAISTKNSNDGPKFSYFLQFLKKIEIIFFSFSFKFLLNSIVYCSHARHVSTWLIVPASYDEYSALVKSGNVASKHVWRAVNGGVLLSYVTFLLVMWWLDLCFFFSTRELVKLRKRRDIFPTEL